MTLESALTYLVAVGLPVWLVVEQVMIRRGKAERQGAQPEAAARPRGPSSRAAEPRAGAVTPTPELTRKAA